MLRRVRNCRTIILLLLGASNSDPAQVLHTLESVRCVGVGGGDTARHRHEPRPVGREN